jgi:hypothetical protein
MDRVTVFFPRKGRKKRKARKIQNSDAAKRLKNNKKVRAIVPLRHSYKVNFHSKTLFYFYFL